MCVCICTCLFILLIYSHTHIRIYLDGHKNQGSIGTASGRLRAPRRPRTPRGGRWRRRRPRRRRERVGGPRACLGGGDLVPWRRGMDLLSPKTKDPNPSLKPRTPKQPKGSKTQTTNMGGVCFREKSPWLLRRLPWNKWQVFAGVISQKLSQDPTQ